MSQDFLAFFYHQGPRWFRLMKKNRGRKSRDTASLSRQDTFHKMFRLDNRQKHCCTVCTKTTGINNETLTIKLRSLTIAPQQKNILYPRDGNFPSFSMEIKAFFKHLQRFRSKSLEIRPLIRYRTSMFGLRTWAQVS